MSKSRYLEPIIPEICFSAKKMAFVSGPRQCGKTTLAKRLLQARTSGKYYNWDEVKFRRQWTKDPSSLITKETDLIVFDELHKAKGWKRELKGIFDTLETPCDILVTGSTRLNVYRKGSDSLMGRYYLFRLHPFSLREMSRIQKVVDSEDLWKMLLSRSLSPSKTHREYLELLDCFGPFPEPLFAANSRTLNLWQRNRVERVIREDLRDLSRLPELSQVEMLTSLLPERVANPISYSNLSEILEVAYSTVKRWMSYLNELYYFFELKPYSKRLTRSIKKSSMLYLWDWSEVEDESARFENLVASHLLKYCHYLTDTGVGTFELRYLRTKGNKEIDFLILKNGIPWLPVEVKLNQTQISTNWKLFLPYLPCKRGIQITKKSGVFEQHTVYDSDILIISADEFLPYLV